MKKVILILLIVLSLFMVTGCGKKEEPKKEEPVLADDEVILEGIMYKLDQDDTGYGIKYKVANNFRKSVYVNAINYFSEKIDDNEYFVFRIFHYKNSTIEKAIKDTTTEYDNRYDTKVGELDYTVVHFVNPIGDHVETTLYYHKHKKDIYVFCFTSAIDTKRLENIFLTNIVY